MAFCFAFSYRARLGHAEISVRRPPSPWYPAPRARPGPNMPNPCACGHFSHTVAPNPSAVTRISSQTHPIFVTGHFPPGLCHEGIYAFLTGSLRVAVDPRKEQDDDDDGDDAMMMFIIIMIMTPTP